MRVLCLGEPLIEFNQTDPANPTSLRLGFGGDTSNCAVAAARLGAQSRFWTKLGADPMAQTLLQLWAREGVDATDCPRDRVASTGAYLITHDANGHLFSYLRAGSAASRMVPEDLPDALFDAVDVLHVSAISQAISQSACDTVFAAIERARSCGATISYDTNLRLALWPLARARAIIEATAAMADIVLPGLDDARQLTGEVEPEAIAKHYLDRGASVVALTLGAQGALVADKHDMHRVPGFRAQAVDASGAGDCFDGAFLVSWFESRDLACAGRFANAAAALSTQGYGAIDPLPDRAAVERLLAET